MDLSQHKEAFAEEEIGGKALSLLGPDDLQELVRLWLGYLGWTL